MNPKGPFALFAIAAVTACGGSSSRNPERGDLAEPEPVASFNEDGGTLPAETVPEELPSDLPSAGAPAVNPASGSGAPPADAGAGGTSAIAPPVASLDAGSPVALDCDAPGPGRAPLRRLSDLEYDNTVSDLLGDSRRPAQAFVSESGRYGNDADTRPMTATRVRDYLAAAETLASNAWPALSSTYPCLATVSADTEADCVSTFVEGFGARAFRRPLAEQEKAELVSLQRDVRAQGSFERSIEWLVSAVLQGPDFLYRLEFGEPDASDSTLRRPTGDEMATRLSYLFWETLPDSELVAAAESGQLDDRAGVLEQATRLLGDARARPMVRNFFDRFLKLEQVTQVVRDSNLYPGFTPDIARLMLEETHGYIEQEIFDGPGTWSAVLGDRLVFVNDALASYYGLEAPGSDEFTLMDVDATSKRRGLLTQGALLVRTSPSDTTSPVARGLFVFSDLLCGELAAPNHSDVPSQSVPQADDVTLGPTARDRFTAVTLSDPACASCHEHIDPIGFALENYDAAGSWRDEENGVTIDATGETELLGTFDGPFELIDRIVENDASYDCLARNLAQFGYGRQLDPDEDACTIERLSSDFQKSGYDVQALLLALTQTDAFLYLPSPEQMP
jgi:hypothetical protein